MVVILQNEEANEWFSLLNKEFIYVKKTLAGNGHIYKTKKSKNTSA